MPGLSYEESVKRWGTVADEVDEDEAPPEREQPEGRERIYVQGADGVWRPEYIA